MGNGVGAVVTILASVVGLAALAVFLSTKSNTANVLTSGGNAFASILNAATSPITGSTSTNVSSLTGGIGFA
jgi:hypothetical protein